MLNKFFDPSTPSMRKGDDRQKKKQGKKMKIVATNVVASQPPERRPTATPTARANIPDNMQCICYLITNTVLDIISLIS